MQMLSFVKIVVLHYKMKRIVNFLIPNGNKNMRGKLLNVQHVVKNYRVSQLFVQHAVMK